MSRRIGTRHFTIGLALVALALLPLPARAEKLLRWKFQKGDQRKMTIWQQTEIAMTKDGRTSNVNMQQTLILRQLVEDVDDQGNATVQHEFDRIYMVVQAAPETSFVYDSAAPDRARGNITEIAPLLKTLSDSAFTTTISPKGKILDVELPENFVAQVENAPTVKPNLLAFSSKEGFTQLMSHSVAVFPDLPVAENDTWTDRVEVVDPAVGKQIVATTYTYEGEEDRAGKPVDRIDVSVTIEFDEQDESGEAKITPTDQKTSGSLWFDAEAGQLTRASVAQKMNMEVEVESQKVQTAITGKFDIEVTTGSSSD